MFLMLIEQDRSKPIAHVVKLFALIKKKKKSTCFLCKVIFEPLLASPLRDETQRDWVFCSRIPGQKCVRTPLCTHSNTAAQDLSNPYSRPGNKGRNIIYLIHIPTHTSALEVFHGHVSDWTQADDFSLLVRKQDKKSSLFFVFRMRKGT